eukprot:4367909-Prymnesium_polylepis.4
MAALEDATVVVRMALVVDTRGVVGAREAVMAWVAAAVAVVVGVEVVEAVETVLQTLAAARLARWRWGARFGC